MKKTSGAMKPGTKAVGNQEVASRGYGGGKQQGELIGAKKLKGHKV